MLSRNLSIWPFVLESDLSSLPCIYNGQQQDRMHGRVKTVTSLNRLQLKGRLLLKEVSLLLNRNLMKTQFLFFLNHYVLYL